MPVTLRTYVQATHGIWPLGHTGPGRRVVVVESAGRVLHGYAPLSVADGDYDDVQISAGALSPVGLPVRTAAQEVAAAVEVTVMDRRGQSLARNQQRLIDRMRAIRAKLPAARTASERSDLIMGICVMAALNVAPAELDDGE